jgi:hypothetical protein
MLSAAELNQIQSEIVGDLPLQQQLAAALLPDVCDIYHDVRTRDTSGQVITTPDPSPRTSRCRVSPTGGGDRLRTIDERLVDINTWDIAVPADTDVVDTDRIVYAGRDFEIIAVQGPRSFETERMVVARRLPM